MKKPCPFWEVFVFHYLAARGKDIHKMPDSIAAVYGKALLEVADDLYDQIQQLWNEAVESGLEAAHTQTAENKKGVPQVTLGKYLPSVLNDTPFYENSITDSDGKSNPSTQKIPTVSPKPTATTSPPWSAAIWKPRTRRRQKIKKPPRWA